MSDRTWVSVTVTTPPHNPLTDIEESAFMMVANGERFDRLSDIRSDVGIEDSNTYVDARTGNLTTHFGESEVRCGDMEQAAKGLVDLMRAGILPKRTFSAMEDAYGGELGWLFEYDCETDRIVQGGAINGDFQIGLMDLVRWYNEHGRNGDAMMRTILDAYDVHLPPPPSQVVAIIDQLNRTYI